MAIIRISCSVKVIVSEDRAIEAIQDRLRVAFPNVTFRPVKAVNGESFFWCNPFVDVEVGEE